MTTKLMPGRRRLLQAFAAVPLAGIVGGKMIAEEIGKASLGMGLSGLSGGMGLAPPVGGYAVAQSDFNLADELTRLIKRRKMIREEVKENRLNNIDYSNIDALRSVSPAVRMQMRRVACEEASIRGQLSWMDKNIAELRKQVDPLDLIGLSDG